MTASTPTKNVIASYETHQAAEEAVKALTAAGVDLELLSIIAKDFQTEEHARGFYSTGDRMQFWGGRGALLGGLWATLFGGAFFFVPIIGPLVVLGPVVAFLVTALEGAVVGATIGVVTAALMGLGVSKEGAVQYELEVKAGKFLVIVRGPEAVIEKARSVMATTRQTLLQVHAAFVTRNEVMGLLSDEEVARVTTAESAPTLAQGDEYVDLEHLDQGVHRAVGLVDMGHVLPRRSVQEATWAQILTRIAAPSASQPRG